MLPGLGQVQRRQRAVDRPALNGFVNVVVVHEDGVDAEALHPAHLGAAVHAEPLALEVGNLQDRILREDVEIAAGVPDERAEAVTVGPAIQVGLMTASSSPRPSDSTKSHAARSATAFDSG